LGALAQANAMSALQSAQWAHDVMAKVVAGKRMPAELKVIAAQIEETLGAATLASGDKNAAAKIWTQTLAGLEDEAEGSLGIKAIRRLLAIDLGNTELATQLGEQLTKTGFNDPRFAPRAGRDP
jgi:hypothetical protein